MAGQVLGGTRQHIWECLFNILRFPRKNPECLLGWGHHRARLRPVPHGCSSLDLEVPGVLVAPIGIKSPVVTYVMSIG